MQVIQKNERAAILVSPAGKQSCPLENKKQRQKTIMVYDYSSNLPDKET